jgi:catechol 2,3-dioxygenase-like lactoylglutathione lyase family enzyme/mannose-6-phosphate isomerase-like protein (cupin superfamily)
MKKNLRLILLVALAVLLGSKGYSSEDGAGIVSLTHVGVGVSDLQKALHFYVDQLGFKEAFRLNKSDGSPLLIYLHVESSNTFVELFPGHNPPSAPAPMYDHMGFAVKDLQATLHTLKDRGYPLEADAFEKASKVAGDGTKYYFVKDPDGNHVELSELDPGALQLKAAPGLAAMIGSDTSASTTPEIPTGITVKNDSKVIPFKSGQLRVLLNGKTGQLSSFVTGTLDMPPGQVVGPETHAKEELIEIFTEGHGEVSLDGKTSSLSPGSVMYVEPQHTQIITNNGTSPLSYYWIKWTAK